MAAIPAVAATQVAAVVRLRPCRRWPASRSTRRWASSACRTGSPLSLLASRSTARVSPSTRGDRPASTCRTNPARSTARYRTSRRARSSRATSSSTSRRSATSRSTSAVASMIHAPATGAGRQGRSRQLGQGRRNRSTRLTAGTVSPCAGHRHRSGQPLAPDERRRCNRAVRVRADRRWPIQPHLHGHRRRRPTIRAASPAAGAGPGDRARHGPRASDHLGGRIAPMCPCRRRSRCAPTSMSTARRST